MTVQEENRVVDADGYVRFVKCSSIINNAPGASSTTLTIARTTGTPNTSNPITVANLLAQTIAGDTFECLSTITMPDGTVYTAKATDGLNAAATWTYGSPYFEGYWRQGPLCTEFVVYVPYTTGGTPHPYLYCAFHISAYKASPSAWDNITNPITGVRVYAFNENGFNGTSTGWSATPQDYAYDWSLKMGAINQTTVLNLTGGAGAGTLTVGAPNGQQVRTVTRNSGTWAVNTSTPNSSDIGKAVYQISTGAIGYIMGFNSSTSVQLFCPGIPASLGASIVAADWKQMGVYHYWGRRVSNTNPAINGSWWGTNHNNVYPVLATSYLKASQMVLNFSMNNTQVANPDLTACNSDGAHPCGMSIQSSLIKNFNTQETSTGTANHIGVYPYEQANAVIFWDSATQHANARKLIMYNAEVGHAKPLWFRHEDYGSFNCIADAGCYTVNTGQSNVKALNVPAGTAWAGAAWYGFALNHSGQANMLPYLVTGDLYHLQNMQCLLNTYGTVCSDNGVFDKTTQAATISGATITYSGTAPFKTGEPVNIRTNGGGLPAVGGVTIANSNRYYYRVATSSTGNLYDTLAHAIAGGPTGQITFSANGSNIYLSNGYVKNGFAPSAGGNQPRQIAWGLRSVAQFIGIMPDSPVSPNVIYYGASKSDARRILDNQYKYMNTTFISNVNYVNYGPHNFGYTRGGNPIFMTNYLRMTALHHAELVVQASTSSNVAALADFACNDAIAWHTDASIYSPGINSSYKTQAAPNFGYSNVPYTYTFSSLMDMMYGTPWGPGGYNYAFFFPSNITATIASVADQANVVVNLSGNWFDVANKAKYEGIAFFGTYSGASPPPTGTYNGYGRIKTINSATQIVVDFTVSGSIYGQTITPISAVVGTWKVGMPIPLPSMSGNVLASDIAMTQITWGNLFSGQPQYEYATLDRSSIEIAKQRGQNTANYAAALADFTNRSYPTVFSNQSGDQVKFAIVSRV